MHMDDSGICEIASGRYGGGDVGFYIRTDHSRGLDVSP